MHMADIHVPCIHVHCIHVHIMCPYICIADLILYLLTGASWPTMPSFDQHKLPAVYVHWQNILHASHLLHGPLDDALYLQHNLQRALVKILISYNASDVTSPLDTDASCNLCAMTQKFTCLRQMPHSLCIVPKTAHRPQSCCMWTVRRLPTASTAY